ncbi:MAG: PqqD family protein [Terracidiphilus sp.]
MQNVGGENLLVPLGSQVLNLNGIVVLNAAGACLWGMLARDCSPDELAIALVERFDVALERARSDTRTFLDEMTQLGVIE